MKGNIKQKVAGLRRGDKLDVRDLSEIARSVVDVLAALELIHSRGAVVVEELTGRRSDRDTVAMLQEAMPKLRKGLTRRVARKNGKRGGRPRITEREMPASEAKAIWKDGSIKSNKDALAKMPGWNYTAAREAFGNSGRKKAGRPKKKVRSKLRRR